MQDQADFSKYVTFNVVDPKLGTPSLMQADNPDDVMADDRLVAFVYTLPDYGLINVEEQLAAQGMEENLRGRAADSQTTPSPDPSAAQFAIESIDGVDVLVAWQLDKGATVWVQNGVLFEVTGPKLSKDQAVALATQIVPTAAKG